MRRSRFSRTATTLLALGALSLGGLGLPAHAQESEVGAAARADESRSQERVLHLSGGQRFRGRARRVGEQWEIQQGGDWQSLRPGQVQRARTVRELEREVERMLSDIERTDHARRAMLASWMVQEGLGQEAMSHLDRVLQAEPDQAQALTVLRSGELQIGLPPIAGVAESFEQELALFAGQAARFRPAGRELAILALGELPGELPLCDSLTRMLVHPAPTRRAFAAHTMRRLYPGRSLRTLFTLALRDVESAVRAEAARALGELGDETIVVPFIDALESETSALRVHAADALGHMGMPAAVPALLGAMNSPQLGGAGSAISARGFLTVTNELAYVQDFDVEIAQGASIADPQVGSVTSGVILDGRALAVQIYRVQTELLHLHTSLKQLTGVDPGNTVGAWNRWWAENEQLFTPSGS